MFLNGYHATGIKEITEQVEIPKGSFYNHFDNKESYALEVIQRYCDNGFRLYENTLLDENVKPLDRIENFFNRVIANYSGNLDFKLGCLMGNFSAELSDINENFRNLLDREFDRLEAVFATCLQQAQEQGTLSKDRDANQLAAFILNSWHGALIRMKTTANAKPLTDCKEMVVNVVLA